MAKLDKYTLSIHLEGKKKDATLVMDTLFEDGDNPALVIAEVRGLLKDEAVAIESLDFLDKEAK